ncbi:MAG: DUF4838 domain-containing protein [Sedimentisphaerales bacterium]|nr:DUF4838 domain-containing protein [Sedimentisphaerales bacterium]
MTCRINKILTPVIAIVLSLSIAKAKALTIASDGKARAAIIVADDAPEPQRHAADELARFLAEITNGDFQIAHVPSNDNHACILVGTEAAKAADPDFTTEGLGSDGIIIRTIGNNLILAGENPRGTLYAVYTFLEDYLGCRWWSSKVSTIPKRRTVEIDNLNVRYVPPFEYREPYWTDAFDGNFAVRNKCNGSSERLDAKRGGKHIYQGFVHTFNPLIPPQRYFEDHPEWFSEIKGKRTADHAQLCLTNEQMRAELVKNLKANLRANPAATIASVSQNDWHNNCQCPNCAEIEKAEASPAGLMLRFVNAIAEEIEDEFPNVAISTLAYQYTRKPPKITKPRHNVIVRLCSIECSFSKPLADERNKAFRDDIVGWSKIADRLYVWDYTTNFRHHVMPHPNLRVLGPNVKFFAEHNVKGLFEQGAYGTYGAEMAELRAWVLAKLLWDPNRNGQTLIDEFIAGYYGPAAPHISEYLKVTHDAVEATGDHLGCFSDHNAKFLSFQTLSEGFARLKAAENAVKDDPELRFRVQVAQLPVIYTLIIRWKEMRDAAEKANADWPIQDSIQQAYDHFVEIAEKKNITRLNEWQNGFVPIDEALKRYKNPNPQ